MPRSGHTVTPPCLSATQQSSARADITAERAPMTFSISTLTSPSVSCEQSPSSPPAAWVSPERPVVPRGTDRSDRGPIGTVPIVIGSIVPDKPACPVYKEVTGEYMTDQKHDEHKGPAQSGTMAPI